MTSPLSIWLNLLRSGLGRRLPEDPVSGILSGTRKVNWALLAPYFNRHWKKGMIGALAILVTTALGFVTPLLTRFLVDDVILAKRLEWLVWAVLGFAVVKGLSSLGSMLEQYLFGHLQTDVSVDLQRNLLDHTLKLPKAFFDDKEVGYLMSRIVSDVQGLTWFFSQTVVYIFTNIIRFIGGMVFVFLLEWRLALISIIVLPALVLSVKVFSRSMNILSHQGMEQNAAVYTRFEETLSSIPLIKAFVSEKKETERVVGEVKTAQRISLEQTVVGSVANAIFNLVPDIAKALVLVAGVYLVIKGNWTLGSLLAFQSYLGYVYGPALSLSAMNMELQRALASLDRVTSLMEVDPENIAGAGKIAKHLQGQVQFEHVTFSYDGHENILEDISFNIEPGEHIAIVGPSGVGKTTLISLLLRFYKPVQGEIFFDDIPASEYELGSLRRCIGYVFQSTQLMEGTISDNLRYGNPDATLEEMERAVKIAGIHDFIDGLPFKYESRVDEKGVNLSEGQKQRLSIARSLIKNPDILILDEPTSALDGIVERSIFEVLPGEVLGKTLFIATHRLSTIQAADRIVVLKDKQLIGFGTHQELLEASDYYRSIYL